MATAAPTHDEAAALHASSYTTLDGRTIPLDGLTAEERAYLARSYTAFRRGMPWDEFGELAFGMSHPLLEPTGGVMTPPMCEHPLFQATEDLEARLGIAQGEVDPAPGDDPSRDPLS